MRISGVKPGTILVATILILLVSFLPQAFASVTLAYDDGNAAFVTYPGTPGVCGVRFSLPSGVTSARLLTVEYQVVRAPWTVIIHITQADHVTEFAGSPISTASSSGTGTFNTLDVSGLGIVVSGDFFVIVDLYFTTSPFNNCVYDNVANVGRSLEGATLSTMTFAPAGNFLIRIVIDPLTFSTIPEYPVGLTVLGLFMVLAYSIIRRRTRN
ncbi:MAG: hypothetical protein ACLP5V_04870 [Candidatus Bathyarchaeia archaeon]